MIDFATRAHNHNYRLDPIIRSLLDTDFYKLLMLNFIKQHFSTTNVTLSLINRSKTIRLADEIEKEELIAQLDYVRSLRFTKSELIWLKGNSFYGIQGIFPETFIQDLEAFQLPDYELTCKDGQFELAFSGRWDQVTLWEIYALSIISELRSRAALSKMSKHEIDILYAQAKTKIWKKVALLNKELTHSTLADFGTRRRHSFLWQEWVVQMMDAELGSHFVGTSNAHLAMKHNLEAIGTNAHELPMVMAALAKDDKGLKNSQYHLLELWERTYRNSLLVFLPDTFGTTQFLKDAPEWLNKWTGVRQDSKDTDTAGEEFIAWWQSRGIDPKKQLLLFSDGLDVDKMIHLDKAFGERTRVSFGWGTLATNDFRDCHPRGAQGLDPLSLVCKVKSADGRPAVKLSDNYSKATGPAEEVERYRRVFGVEGIENAPTIV